MQPIKIIMQSLILHLLLVASIVLVCIISGCREKIDTKQAKIIFVSNRDGNTEIYVMNPDGTGQKNLTNSNDMDSQPSWSPDGKKITFLSFSTKGICIMNSDGSGKKYLTNIINYQGENYSLCWSPLLVSEK